MLHEVLVEGVRLGDQDDERFASLAADAADPLPGRHHGAGIATRMQTSSPPTSIPSSRHSSRRPHQLAAEEPSLDLAALLGKISRPVGESRRASSGRLIGGPRVNQLGDPARLREGDRPEPRPHRLDQQRVAVV